MESISKIKLKNQAGAITMLKGYVKVASDSEAYYKCGATDNFDVGQSGMIDLNDHIGDAEKKQSRKDGYIFPGDLVTIFPHKKVCITIRKKQRPIINNG